MQVLVVLAPGHGHLYPTFGLAGALRDAGHKVTYAMVDNPSLRERVVSEGHRFVAVPPSLAEQKQIVETGLREDPSLAGIFGALAPPAVASLASLVAEFDARLVPVPLGTGADDALSGLPHPPWVWVTLGTVFNANVTAWGRLAEELKGVGAQFVATVGNGVQLRGLPPLPPNFTVVPFVPARALLEGAVAVLCQAGAGTLLGALRYGLPLVCWPQGTDQFHNAQTCEAAGASVTINDAAEAAQGLRSVLDGKGYRSAAQSLQREVLEMPSAAECVPVLEGLAR
jgi:UDP:flavonoid glycosyltransferase YjiC (YdhE family)